MCFFVGWKHVCFPPSTCLCMSLVILQHYFYVNLISIDLQGISNTLRHLFLNCLPAGDSFVVLFTIPATNLAPESGWLEDEILLGWPIFSGRFPSKIITPHQVTLSSHDTYIIQSNHIDRMT